MGNKEHIEERGGAGTNYWPQLDGLRALSFFYVFLRHAGPIPGSGPVLQFANAVMDKGVIGVNWFFALSGFLITALLLQEKREYGRISLLYFYFRRALRIWPVYYLVLVAAFYILPHGHVSPFWKWYYRDCYMPLFRPFLLFIGNMYLGKGAQLIYGMSTLMHMEIYRAVLPLWSVCVEEQFYAVWPICTSLFRARVLVAIALAVAIGSASYRIAVWQDMAAYYYNTFGNLDAIMWGALSAIVYRTVPAFSEFCRRNGLILAAALLYFFIYFGVAIPRFELNSWPYHCAYTFVAPASALFVVLCVSWQPLSKPLSGTLLARIGKVTYTAYLVHYFILGFCPYLIPPAVANQMVRWFSTVILALLLTLGVSAASWVLIESHTQRWRKRLHRRPRVQTREHALGLSLAGQGRTV